MTADKDGTLVENARNYITFNVAGDAELVGMDNGDSTDYEEYTPEDSAAGGARSHTRRLFANRLIAIVRSKRPGASFVVTAASAGLENVSMKFDGSTGGAAGAGGKIAIDALLPGFFHGGKDV